MNNLPFKTRDGRQMQVVSPHRDDAAFSVGITIDLWLRSGRPVKVVNCYTVSEYAPFRPESCSMSVTRLRLAEDEAFARHLGGGIELVDLGLLDAPLRLGCAVEDVCNSPAPCSGIAAEVARLTETLQPTVGQGILLVPLAVGNHIDHLIARQSCLTIAGASSIAFYEDLPYSAEMRAEEIAAVKLTVEGLLRRPLQSIVIGADNPSQKKLELVSWYKSQLGEWEMRQITDHTVRTGGERIWLDEASAAAFHVALDPRLCR